MRDCGGTIMTVNNPTVTTVSFETISLRHNFFGRFHDQFWQFAGVQSGHPIEVCTQRYHGAARDRSLSMQLRGRSHIFARHISYTMIHERRLEYKHVGRSAEGVLHQGQVGCGV